MLSSSACVDRLMDSLITLKMRRCVKSDCFLNKPFTSANINYTNMNERVANNKYMYTSNTHLSYALSLPFNETP